MAKIAWVEGRLVRWAECVTVGRDGSGFPSINVLSKDWSPPSPGTTPTLKVGLSLEEVKRTHRAISFLSLKLSNAVCVHYCMRLSVAEQMVRLQCAEPTLFARIDRVHRELSLSLGQRNSDDGR